MCVYNTYIEVCTGCLEEMSPTLSTPFVDRSLARSLALAHIATLAFAPAVTLKHFPRACLCLCHTSKVRKLSAVLRLRRLQLVG